MRNIVISDKAKQQTLDLFNYLEVKWSVETRKKFAIKLKKTIKIIRFNPESFPKSDIIKTQYKCVVTKQTTVYYKFNHKEIRILALFDTRQHPKKINKI